jgi:hypothetical protein
MTSIRVALVAAFTMLAGVAPAHADTLRNGFSVERLGRVDALIVIAQFFGPSVTGYPSVDNVILHARRRLEK